MNDETIMIQNSANYDELMAPNSLFLNQISLFANSFSTGGSVWNIPNFSTVNKDNNIVNYLAQAFINKYVTKDPEKNYEYFETVGDKMCKSAFMSYIILKFPQSKSSHGITLSFSKYMSKLYQAELTFKYIKNYNEIMNVLIKNNLYRNLTVNFKNKLAEDIFESVMGAIYMWGERKCPCSGIIYISQILKLMLDNNQGITDPNQMQEGDVATLENISKDLSSTREVIYSKPYDTNQGKMMSCTFRFYITESNRPVLKEFIVSTQLNNDQDIVKAQLARMMIERLNNEGFTKENIEIIKRERNVAETKLIKEINKIIEERRVNVIKNTTKKSDEINKFINTQINRLVIKQSYSYIDTTGQTRTIEATANTRVLALQDLLKQTRALFTVA